MRTPERIRDIFAHRRGEMARADKLSRHIRDRIEGVSDFIEENSSAACSDCPSPCCIEKYSRYTCDDLVYIYSLGLKPERREHMAPNEPCHFLKEDGCALDRTVRPMGCNWHFCDDLIERMSDAAAGSEYEEFTDSMEEIITLWIELMGEFRLKYREFTDEDMTSPHSFSVSGIAADH
jgi:hypothetical protein